MVERPILFQGAMARELLASRTERKRMYAPRGTRHDDPSHLARRLANGLNEADEANCWEWQRTCNDDGYGQLRVAGRMVYAHRLAFELGVGPVPSGMKVLHRCDNPACINPKHLFAGTQSDNMRDCFLKGRSRGAVMPGGSA